MQHRPPSLRAWLWWLALFILACGGSIAYMVRMNNFSPSPGSQFVLVVAVTGVLFGLCVISATADWWLRR